MTLRQIERVVTNLRQISDLYSLRLAFVGWIIHIAQLSQQVNLTSLIRL